MARRDKEFNGPGMEPHVIKALLMMKKIPLVELAQEHGVGRSNITMIINRDAESYPVKLLIAERLGLPYEVVWGVKPRKAA